MFSCPRSSAEDQRCHRTSSSTTARRTRSSLEARGRRRETMATTSLMTVKRRHTNCTDSTMCVCEDTDESCKPPAKITLVKKANQDLGETADVFEIRRAVNFRACVCARCPVSCSVKLRIVVRSKLQQRNMLRPVERRNYLKKSSSSTISFFPSLQRMQQHVKRAPEMQQFSLESSASAR